MKGVLSAASANQIAELNAYAARRTEGTFHMPRPLRIDLGPGGKAELGERGTFAPNFRRAGPSILSKSIDDRIGVASLLELVTGAPRAPYCLMGVCFDCLVTIDGVGSRQGCLVAVREGMEVETQVGKREAGR